jgi:hypothetical protein
MKPEGESIKSPVLPVEKIINLVVDDFGWLENFLKKRAYRKLFEENERYCRGDEYVNLLREVNEEFIQTGRIEELKKFLDFCNGEFSPISYFPTIPENWRYFSKIKFHQRWPGEEDVKKLIISGRIFEEIGIPASRSVWREADLAEVVIKKLSLRRKSIDLWQGVHKIQKPSEEIVLDAQRLQVSEYNEILDFGTCFLMEGRFLEIFDKKSREFNNGVVLFLTGKPIGIFKMTFGEEKTMLALRTVVDQDGKVVFYKGMVYGWMDKDGYLKVEGDQIQKNRNRKRFVNKGLLPLVVNARKNGNKILCAIHLDDLQRDAYQKTYPLVKNHLRFVNNPKVIQQGNKLVRQIEKGGVELQWLRGEDVWRSFAKKS